MEPYRGFSACGYTVEAADDGNHNHDEPNIETKPKQTMRIPIPQGPDDFIKLALALSAQHTKLGAASPLSNIKGIDQLAPLATTADTQNKLADQLYEQAETATEARDKAIGDSVETPGCLRFLVTAARDVLAGVNKGEVHQLGDWGFNVNAPLPSTTEQKAAAKAARAAVKAVQTKSA